MTRPAPCSAFGLTLLACTLPRLQAVGTDAHGSMDQLTAEFKQETTTLKKKAKQDLQKVVRNAVLIQNMLAEQANNNDLDEDDDDDL